MKTNNIIFQLILVLVFNLTVEAQIKKAEKHFQMFNYAKAIPLLTKAASSEKKEISDKATFMLADCYRLTNNAGLAMIWYEKAINIDNSQPINYYYLGQSYRTLGLYEKAADAFLNFKLNCPDTLDAQKFYEYSISIQNWLDLPPLAEIRNVETLNTRYSDFGPAKFKNGIVFTSDRLNDALDNKYGWTNFNYLNLYYAEPEYFMNLWSPFKPAEKLGKNFNDTYHNGPAAFTNDNKKMLVTKTVKREGKKDKDNIRTAELSIYIANIEESNKMKYEAFQYNNENYSVAHPALSPDNTQMVFSSDMPGGLGKSDLYLSKLQNGKWSVPKNLGNLVNTNGNDVFPYWSNDSVIYFSSDGHMGYGGLDIYKTILRADSIWSAPENLKAPLNSSYDDFGIIFAENQTEGLLSSNRPDGKGADDIYAFKNLEFAEPQKTFKICGFVKDSSSGKPLNDATVFILDSNTNKVQIAKTNVDGRFESEAKHNQAYFAKALKDSFLYDCLSFRTPIGDEDMYLLPKDLLLSKIVVEYKSQVKILYDLDKWDIKDDAKQTLDSLVRFMKEYPIRAELSSHTDSRATAEYNLQLSQKRADAAVNYIISKGISADRIVSRGYGESSLINKCADNVQCTEQEHQVNRRTEFKIIGIDQRLLSNNKYNLDVFRSGDILSPEILGTDFFNNCNLFDEKEK